MSANPYQDRPDYAFWRRAVAGRAEADVDPMVQAPFTIGREDRIATAGSCFAQHISRALAGRGYRYLVTETAPEDGSDDEGWGVFPARFGNIYTARQLLQTFDRAYGLFEPADRAWRRADGAWADPFRPLARKGGFASPADLEADRGRHLAAVREMFESCEVFIFTLGLTETWASAADGAVFPLAPGVAGGESGDGYVFKNLSAGETTADLSRFLGKLRTVNPGVRTILTVSPVPLIATYAPEHVLVATSYSKAALRTAAEEIRRAEPAVAYFPAYEIISGPQARGRYFAADLRSVTEEGVQRVMGVFSRHFLAEVGARASRDGAALTDGDERRLAELADVVCDEEAIDAPSPDRP